MSDDDKAVREIRVRIRDSEAADQSTSWNDTYSLIVRSDGKNSATRTYAKTESALEIGFEIEEVSVDDIPQRVAGIMQKYADDSVIDWPSSYSADGSVEMEEVEITAENDDDVYSFRLHGGQIGRVVNDGQIIEISQVPHGIKSDVDAHIPNEIEFV